MDYRYGASVELNVKEVISFDEILAKEENITDACDLIENVGTLSDEKVKKKLKTVIFTNFCLL